MSMFIKILIHVFLTKLKSKLLLNFYSNIKRIIKTHYKIIKPSSGD